MSGVLVVGVDGSENSAAALEWSVTEASIRGDVLKLVYCLHVPMATAAFADAVAAPQIDVMREYAEGVLAAVAETARGMEPELEVQTELLVGPPSAALLEESKDASLLVVGARGLGAFGSMFLGSVSTRVAARAECPTVVVPSDGHEHDRSGPIVVGVDDSLHAVAALRFAAHLASLNGNEIIAVHGRGDTSNLDLPANVEHTEQAQAEALVAEAIERAGMDREGADLRVTTRVVAADPGEALIEAAENASIVVVGSRGHGGFRGMLLGSVSQSVLHEAKRPVAVVHAEQG